MSSLQYLILFQSRRIFIRGITSEVTEESIYLSLIWVSANHQLSNEFLSLKFRSIFQKLPYNSCSQTEVKYNHISVIRFPYSRFKAIWVMGGGHLSAGLRIRVDRRRLCPVLLGSAGLPPRILGGSKDIPRRRIYSTDFLPPRK